MSISITRATAFFIVVFFGFVGCRAPDPVDDTESETSDSETSELPEPAPNGGCPDDSWDQFDNSLAPFIGGETEIRVEVSIASCFHCPHCLDFAMGLMEFLKDQDHKDFVRVYFHHYPLMSYVDSWRIHYASIAVANQSIEKFWLLHDEVFLREYADDRMTIEEVVEYADTVLELDMDQFNEDRESDVTYDFVASEKQQAQDQGLTGTPSVWVCGTKIGWGQLQEVVKLYLYSD